MSGNSSQNLIQGSMEPHCDLEPEKKMVPAENIAEGGKNNAMGENNLNLDNKDFIPKKEDIRRKKKSRYYENYITKLLKKISEKSEITLNAKQQLNSFIVNLSRKISSIAGEMTEISKKKTISPKEIKNTIRLMLHPTLAAECISFAAVAAENYEEEKESEKTIEPDSKICSKQVKAGLVFPPSICEKFLRRWGNSSIMVSWQAPIYLASVLEYITSEILEESSILTISAGRVRIVVRDVAVAVRQHPHLSDLSTRYNLEFLGGGVLPFIHPSIKYDKNGQRTKISYTIESYQNTSDCLIFPKHPFENAIRTVVNSVKPNSKISSDVLTLIQYYIEQWLAELLKNANSIALNSNRAKVLPRDIELVLTITEKTRIKSL